MSNHKAPSPDRPSLAVLSAVAIAVLFVLTATACGESQADKEASQYADSLCTNISGWEQQITGIAASLDSGSPKSVAKTKLEQAKAATVALVNQIHGLELPDIDGAAEAKQNVDQLLTDSQSSVDTVKAGITQIESYGSDTANVATVVVPIGLQLTRLVTEAKNTASNLEKIKGPFEKAVKKSDACQALKPSENQS